MEARLDKPEPEKLTAAGQMQLLSVLNGAGVPQVVEETTEPGLKLVEKPEGVVCKDGVCSLGSWKPTRKVA